MAIATDIDSKIHRFINLVSKKITVVQAYVFGSSVRGIRHDWSDIDLAIVSSDFSGDRFEDYKLLIPFILEVDRSLEVHPFHPRDFNEDNPFIKEILTSGLKIV
jgi:uncharacterized protein